MNIKKVELTELFYDLVFVYAISKMTALIHHLHHGVIEPIGIITFLIAVIVVINVWVYQNVFINRYGRNSLWDNLALHINMAFMLFLSNTFTTSNWEAVFMPFTLVTGGTSIVLSVQYIVQYFKETSPEEKTLTRNYVIILSIRSFVLCVAAVIPYAIGINLFFVGIIAGVILPFFVRNSNKRHPVQFGHLVERWTLLIIIAFGEMLIGIAPYFMVTTFDVRSILMFILVISLFMFYIVKFDHLIDHHRTNETGFSLVYCHYLIFIGLSFVTATMGFFDEEVNHLFLLACLYGGLFCFYVGIYAQKQYNQQKYNYPKSFVWTMSGIFGAGLVGSLIFYQSLIAILAITMVMALVMCALYIRFNLSKIHVK